MENFSKLDWNQKMNLTNMLLAVISVVVGHLAKGKTGRFAKTISFFLRASNNNNSCKVVVTGKRVNLGDGNGLQILCNLHFTGHVNFIKKLKEILPPLIL